MSSLRSSTMSDRYAPRDDAPRDDAKSAWSNEGETAGAKPKKIKMKWRNKVRPEDEVRAVDSNEGEAPAADAKPKKIRVKWVKKVHPEGEVYAADAKPTKKVEMKWLIAQRNLVAYAPGCLSESSTSCHVSSSAIKAATSP